MIDMCHILIKKTLKFLKSLTNKRLSSLDIQIKFHYIFAFAEHTVLIGAIIIKFFNKICHYLQFMDNDLVARSVFSSEYEDQTALENKCTCRGLIFTEARHIVGSIRG